MQATITNYFNKGIRFDGRTFDKLRPISIQTHVSETAEGSALVTWGDTKIIAGVKLSVEQPFPDVPDKGNLMVNAELLPLSSPDFESGPPDARSIELARVVDRGIREGKALDLSQMVIEPGKKVWTANVDICILNHDGNLIDASALAAIVALMNTYFPEYDAEHEKVNYKAITKKRLPVLHIPIAVTVSKIGGKFVVDLTKEEEELVEARLTITSLENQNLCALQKGGDQGLLVEEIQTMIELALAKANEIRKKI
ncbi:MAG: exosome complex protein Rrp42 [Candidatus Woesearchaeota archaeon]